MRSLERFSSSVEQFLSFHLELISAIQDFQPGGSENVYATGVFPQLHTKTKEEIG